MFSYFLPYWPRGPAALACIGAAAALGLVPALVTKGLIDYLAQPKGGLGPLVLIVGAGVGAPMPYNARYDDEHMETSNSNVHIIHTGPEHGV